MTRHDGSLLLTATAAAKRCGVSRAVWWRWLSAGLIPKPVKLGRRCTRWRAEEIDAWVRAGCPSREKWEAMTAGGAR